MKNELVMEPVFDTIEEIDLVKNQDDLTPEQRAYWLESIERDMRNMDQPKKYVSLGQFGQELIAAVKSKICMCWQDFAVIVDYILKKGLSKLLRNSGEGLELRIFFRSQRTTFLQFATHRFFPDNIARRNEQNTNKTIKPADETEVIADVIIRESETTAMD